MSLETLFLTCSAEPLLTAAAGESRPKISILGYSGGEMSPGGWGSVVVDLAGVTAADKIPLLADHDSSVAGVIGEGRPQIRGGALTVEGELVPGGAKADRLIQLGRAGQKLQASIGLSPTKIEHLGQGDIVEANGRRFKAGPVGLRIIRAGVLKEVSVLALGADGSTSTSIKARNGVQMSEIDVNGNPLEVNAGQAVLHAVAPVTAAPQPLAGQVTPPIQAIDPVAGERSRVADIVKACAKFPEIQAKAIAEGWPVDKAKAHALEHLLASRPEVPNAFHFVDRANDAQHLACGLMLRAGQSKAAEKAYGANICQQADHLRSASLVDYCRASLVAQGLDVPSARQDMIRAAFSSLSLPQALGDSMHKSLVQAYNDSPATWRSFCAIRPVTNFKDHKDLRPSFTGELQQVGAAGQVQHVGMDETGYTYSVDTYAAQFKVTRRDIINDDLSFIQQMPNLMASAASRKIADLVYSVLLANAGNFFHAANNGNYITGTDTVLSIAGLTRAVNSMRSQTDDENNNLDISPKTLLVPTALEVTGRALLTSAYLQQQDSATPVPTGNPHLGALTLAVEPRLDNVAKFAAASATAWYLFASPANLPMTVAFLDGKEAPSVEYFGLDHDINTLGMAWRVVHDFGAAMADPRAALKSKGAV